MADVKSIRALERDHQRAMRAEAKAIEALDRMTNLPKAKIDAAAARCWELAAETNRARKALTEAYDNAATARQNGGKP